MSERKNPRRILAVRVVQESNRLEIVRVSWFDFFGSDVVRIIERSGRAHPPGSSESIWFHTIAFSDGSAQHVVCSDVEVCDIRRGAGFPVGFDTPQRAEHAFDECVRTGVFPKDG